MYGHNWTDRCLHFSLVFNRRAPYHTGDHSVSTMISECGHLAPPLTYINMLILQEECAYEGNLRANIHPYAHTGSEYGNKSLSFADKVLTSCHHSTTCREHYLVRAKTTAHTPANTHKVCPSYTSMCTLSIISESTPMHNQSMAVSQPLASPGP